MICKNCNSEIPNDSEYCSFCGNVTESVISSNNATGLKKGYTYLELKQWNDADQFFREAIINDENTAAAYIGKMLARYKADSIESLAASGKKFSSDDDFKLALKYADGKYADYLKECVLNAESKTKKRTIIVSSICACVAALALVSYFVFIPLGRNIYYKDLLTDGKAKKAAKSYTSSKWFEYDKMAKDLFYENGLKLVELKDYKNAEICFEITNGYTDNEKYLNYCKAQNLLANDDLESYNYFTNLGDFLDSKEILNTNEYFVMVSKLQGEWYFSGKTIAILDAEMIADGYKISLDSCRYEKINKSGYENTIHWLLPREEQKEETICVDGLKWGNDIDIYISDGKIRIGSSEIEFDDDSTITIYVTDYGKKVFREKWQKVSK